MKRSSFSVVLTKFSFQTALLLALSAVSGLLLILSMPGFDVPLIGWVALVPLLMVLLAENARRTFLLALPFGMVFSIGVHNWYPAIFPSAWGYFLIFAGGMYSVGLLHLGVWLYSRLPAPLAISVSKQKGQEVIV